MTEVKRKAEEGQVPVSVAASVSVGVEGFCRAGVTVQNWND